LEQKGRKADNHSAICEQINSNIDKAHAFANHLANVFQPHPSVNLPDVDEAIAQLLETPYQLEPPVIALPALKSSQ
jgi:hypothetical protein